MNTVVFDGIVREMSADSTRRSVFRLLGGAAAMSAGLALGGESLAKGKRSTHGKAKSNSRDNVSVQGKKGKKITICYQNQTRLVKKQGYQKKYPGATVGTCSPVPPPPDKVEPQPQPAACTSWILSGGPEPTARIAVDDDLWIYHKPQAAKDFVLLFRDNDGLASSLAAVSFAAQVGDTISVLAKDVNAACRSLSPLWLHCASTGQKRMLYAGNTDGCAPGRTPSYFHSAEYTVSL